MAGKGGECIASTRFGGVGVCAVIPLFFYAVEIAAVGMLLFLRESAPLDILTIRAVQQG